MSWEHCTPFWIQRHILFHNETLSLVIVLCAVQMLHPSPPFSVEGESCSGTFTGTVWILWILARKYDTDEISTATFTRAQNNERRKRKAYLDFQQHCSIVVYFNKWYLATTASRHHSLPSTNSTKLGASPKTTLLPLYPYPNEERNPSLEIEAIDPSCVFIFSRRRLVGVGRVKTKSATTLCQEKVTPSSLWWQFSSPLGCEMDKSFQ